MRISVHLIILFYLYALLISARFMRKYPFKSIVFCFLFFVSCIGAFAQLNNNTFIKHIDSATNIIDENPKLAKLYLDSIPQPIEKNIEGRLAEYYQLKGIINDDLDEQTLILEQEQLNTSKPLDIIYS